MKFTSSIPHRYACCALAFPLCITAHASTIATVTADASYDAPVGSFNVPCSQTSQTDLASASCSFSSDQADYSASAEAADGDISVNETGARSEADAVAEANALASFTDSFTFIPDNGQNAPTQVQYTLLYGFSSFDAPSTMRFNGVLLGSCDYFQCEGHNTETIKQLYSGGTFESAGQVTASFDFEEGIEYGFASAELQLQSITMLDAQGQAVAGTLVPTPEPALWPLTGLLGVGLALFAKRRAGRLL